MADLRSMTVFKILSERGKKVKLNNRLAGTQYGVAVYNRKSGHLLAKGRGCSFIGWENLGLCIQATDSTTHDCLIGRTAREVNRRLEAMYPGATIRFLTKAGGKSA